MADLIDQQKDDFYSKYRYLKPDCEKDFWEKAIDRAHSIGEWCREHWKAAVTIVLVGVSVSLTGDIGDVLIKGEDISLGQMIQHAVVSAAFSMAFAAIFYGIGKAFRALRPQPVGEGTGGGSSAEGGADAFDYYMDLVEKLDVSTEPNTATFYSGEGNRVLAEEFARINGKVTLETTPGGAYLDSLGLFNKDSPLTVEEAINVWARLSARYAQGASGNAYGFVEGARLESIFNMVEYPELLNNPDIINIFTEFMK